MTTPGLAAAGLLVALVLTGCSQAEDIATDTAGDAACALAQRTLDEVLAQTQGAVDELGVDPAAAARRRIALRDTAQAAGAGRSGESRGLARIHK
ncbi:MAG: hypothetical protein LH468_03260 [Nocardioides sp.]|nr:hypothetical protein [Nocardioides sp.]